MWKFQHDIDYINFSQIIECPYSFANLCGGVKANDTFNYIDNMVNNKYSYSLGPRQSGKTLALCSYGLWYAYNYDYSSTAIFTRDATSGKMLLDYMRKMIEPLPEFMHPHAQTKTDFRLQNSSRIFLVTDPYHLRGHSVSNLLVDDAAYIDEPKLNDLFSTMWPVVASSKKSEMHIVSTPAPNVSLIKNLWEQKNEFGKTRTTWEDFWDNKQIEPYKTYLPSDSYAREYEVKWV